jgi:hypothetical protein
MKILLILTGLLVAGGLSCHLFKADEPKQRQDYVASPMRYGDTQFEGIRAPGAAADAGFESSSSP